MAHFVYIIKSLKDQKFYIGETTDLNRRLFEHNQGWVKSTRYRVPFVLVHSEEVESREIALKREKQIKSFKGGQAFKKLLNLAD
ncbi:MAG: GIY-YIG nuclease family protein [Lentimicrobium sp.]|nr:GIY-YIG nuclease family protein [Lentimicrobium sp.]